MVAENETEVGEKTVVKGTGLSAHAVGSHIAAVDFKDGKIVRIRPLHYDSKYQPEEFKPWQIEARGRVFKPPMKSLITAFGIGYKKRVYSPNRILYPLKRVDWLGNPPTGNKLNFDVVDIFRIENGKIAEHWDVADTLKLFTQVGRIK